MPIISPDSGYLTVLNLFSTDTPDRQDQLVAEMRRIVDSAAYPGWISSTVHSGQDKMGTANFIQWRGREDLEARYAGEEFKHRTVPLFTDITTSVKLLQNEVAFTQHHSSVGDQTEIVPERSDYTVIEIFGVQPKDQDDLVNALGEGQRWLLDVPGYRSHTVLRGMRAQDGREPLNMDRAFAVVYSQWADKQSYDTFRTLPPNQQSEARNQSQRLLDSLITTREWNSYRVVHTRSASQQ
jgi:heme-degrading monooxygenase HmoA